jgi:glycerol-3-phosphate acyltransferase PlsX
MSENTSHPVKELAGNGFSGQASGRIVISVDAMGGDQGPAAVVAGLVLSADKNSEIHFILHGDEAILGPMLARQPVLAGRCDLRHAPRVVTMDDKPSQVMRHGQGTSMWSCIESVKLGEATVAVSCGNTGALMAVSMIRLRKLPGVNRPAIACLWPSRNEGGFNVMLDVGADVKAEPEDLLQYATMGASYARNGLHLARPRVGLLNVGTEEHKGRAELKAAYDMMPAIAKVGDFEFVGYVEGGDIPGNRVDVIVTDGFTGNIALKTGEGTAKLISELLRSSLGSTLLAKIGALFSLGALRNLQKRIDPRRVNGGVFLGLNGTVVKSHGSADATGVSAAIRLAFQLAKSGFNDRLAARLASASLAGQDATGQDLSNSGGAK